jgi:uncharacterized membrane protein YdjX (TVP38/TMEM64 family)
VALAQPADLAAPARPIAGFTRGALLLAGLAAAGVALRVVGAGALKGGEPTLAGAIALVAAGGVLSAAGVPRQAVAFGAGYVFGAWNGAGLAMVALMLGCAADFWWARTVARNWAIRRLRGRLARIDRFLAQNPFTATLTLRLLPVGNNLAVNLLAGVSGVRAWPFLAASAIGYVPQTLVFALVGSGVHVDRAVQVGLGVGLFAASGVLGAWLMRTRMPV